MTVQRAMSERFELGFRAATAEQAMAEARAWAKAEPRWRLRTIASCRPAPNPEMTAGAGPRWIVTVVVNRIEPVPA